MSETFACGCMIWTDGDVFYIKPCNENCEVFEFVKEESAKKGNPMMYQYEGSAAG